MAIRRSLADLLFCRRFGHRFGKPRPRAKPQITPCRCWVCGGEFYFMFVDPAWGGSPEEVVEEMERQGII